MEFDIKFDQKDREHSSRAQEVMSDFDMNLQHSQEHFCGNIDIDGYHWSVGAIVGGSGTGKSSIAKHLFPQSYIREYEYKGDCVLDDMPPERTTKEIELAFSAVGFSSPPSWLKPYNVLSTGEKMRVDLARAILQTSKLVVFDEFTSVVDRTVAKTASFALQKAIRKQDKQFIAVSCHKDILDWLQPDWVYDTDKKSFFGDGVNVLTPLSSLTSIEWTTALRGGVWEVFRKYHYLNTDIHKASTQYVGILNDEVLVCHTGVIQAAMKKGVKRVHRFVTLPEYQGIGIGMKFITFIADLYVAQGLKFNLITTTPALRFALEKSMKWSLVRSGKVTPPGKSRLMDTDVWHNRKSLSCNRITYSFDYVHNSNGL